MLDFDRYSILLGARLTLHRAEGLPVIKQKSSSSTYIDIPILPGKLPSSFTTSYECASAFQSATRLGALRDWGKEYEEYIKQLLTERPT